MTEKKENNWMVEHDLDKCALCVVCARNCPTGALRREEDEESGTLRLYYRAELCDGCDGELTCQTRCPEEAIQIHRHDDTVSGESLLRESEMVQCAYCDEFFAPVRRLDVISEKRLHREVNRMFCPLCRRKQMVVDFIETHRAPNSKAVYRNARDILRKAGYEKDGKRQQADG